MWYNRTVANTSDGSGAGLRHRPRGARPRPAWRGRPMPLLDHFRPPLHPRHHWESFHSNWATRLADLLNERLPPEFMAEEYTHGGTRLEIDVATFERPSACPGPLPDGPATATLSPPA